MFQKITEAPIIWKLLNGVVCIYKPAGKSLFECRNALLGNLTRELCEMECRPPVDYVSIEGDTTKELSVQVSPDLSDLPLVVGPRYQPKDLRFVWATFLGRDTSGVCLIGLGNGVSQAQKLHNTRPVRTYHIQGELGKATDNYFSTGKVVEKSSFKHVRKEKIDRISGSIQASHQGKMFEVAGVEPGSQEAYDLAVKGFIRATNKNLPVLYGIKCIEFKAPNFILEVQSVNEYEMYLKTLIHDFGLKLHTNATCVGIQCVRQSYFTLENALLKKHWRLQHVLNNLLANKSIIESHKVTQNIVEVEQRRSAKGG